MHPEHGSTRSCCVNGNPACVRGFIRDRCRKCTLGSISCDMCQTSPALPLPSAQNHPPTRKRKLQRLGSSSKAVSAQDPSRSLSHSTLSINTSSSTPQAPSSPVSLSTPSPVSTPLPSPATTLAFSRPSPPQPCAFCFNGRKVCEDCFGLGYVQRICQDCIRESHRQHYRRRKGSLASPSVTLNQIGHGMGEGWTRLKEQVLQTTSSATAAATATANATTQRTLASLNQARAQLSDAFSIPQSSSPSSSSPTSATSQQVGFTLSLIHEQPDRPPAPQDEQSITVKLKEKRKARMSFSRELSDHSAELSLPVNAAAAAAAAAPMRPAGPRRRSQSFRLAVMKHLKVPALFSHASSRSTEGEDETVSPRGHHQRRRLWTLSMLTTPIHLRAASTAA